MPKEYVERDYAIREACRELCGCEPNECGFDKPCAIVERYKNWPAADVRENVKANWTDHEIFPAKGNVDMLQSAFCPNCKRYHTTPYSYYFTHYAYCPNCGAKMEVKDG